jgi:hypothetical protein
MVMTDTLGEVYENPIGCVRFNPETGKLAVVGIIVTDEVGSVLRVMGADGSTLQGSEQTSLLDIFYARIADRLSAPTHRASSLQSEPQSRTAGI